MAVRIRLKIGKSVNESAAAYYEEAKKLRKKIEGIERAIAETEKEIEKAKQEKKKEMEEVRVKREKRWFEKFHWFYTSGGRLAVGGKNAQQNDIVYSKYMEENDLFFHADIQGGSAVILKDGLNATEEELRETAQFAASFSNAWKNANASVDVYAVRKEQLSKHVTSGYIPTGGFAISGERIWFRATPLGLRIGKSEKGLEIGPAIGKRKIENAVFLLPARTGKEKGELVKGLAKRFGVHRDELLEILPSGRSKIKT